MKINVAYYSVPKAGNTNQENEDAYAGPPDGELDGSTFTFALADGATSTLLSKNWAELITKSFTKIESKSTSEDALIRKNLQYDLWQSIYLAEADQLIKQACFDWEQWLHHYFKNREMNGKPVQWYEEPGFASGAYSSLVQFKLLELPKTMNIYFEVLAIGDSCFFWLRNDKIMAFPIESSKDFNNQPNLLSSNQKANKNILEYIRINRGRFQQEDRFYLMTDALAKWFLVEYETQKQPWLTINNLDTKDQKQPFEEWINSLRANGQLFNDDVALIRIDIY